MTSRDTWSSAFGGASVEGMQAYEYSMVTAVFEPWGELLCDEVGIRPGDDVLDVACGPGSVSRIAARRSGGDGHVVGCDLSPAMLAIAQSKLLPANAASVEYRESPAAPLSAEDASFDVVLCQQGLQFFPDRPAALLEMHRALRPGGRVGIATWVSIERNIPWRAIYRAVGRIAGSELAEKYRGGPWGLADAAALESLLADAGFGNVRVHERELDCVFAGGPDQVVATIPASGVAAEVAALSTEQQDDLAAVVRSELDPFREGSTVRCPTASLVATASR